MKRTVSVFFAFVLIMCLCVPALADDTIKIGMIGPLTGPAASYGNSVKQGCEIAVEEINALGGIQLEISYQDDQHDAEISVNAYNNVMDWGAKMIVGTVTTNPCLAVSSIAYEERVFMMTPSASSLDVIANKDNMYQICFTDPAMGAHSAEYISEHKLAEKIAIIYNNADAYSTGIYQAFTEKANELGLNIVETKTFTDETTDFSVQITAAKEAGADLVFLPIYYTPASMIFNQAASMEYSPTYFGVDGMDGILQVEGFDTSLAEGVILLTPFSDASTEENVVNFVTKYVAAYGVIPDQFAADGYDAVYALYTAINEAGITPDTSYEDACESIISVITKIEVNGVTGTMTWSPDGTVTKDPKAVRIENGAYVEID